MQKQHVYTQRCHGNEIWGRYVWHWDHVKASTHIASGDRNLFTYSTRMETDLNEWSEAAESKRVVNVSASSVR